MDVGLSPLDLEVMEGCTVMGKMAARAICSTVPGLDEAQLADAYGAEFFEVARQMHESAVIEGQHSVAQRRAQGMGL